MYSSGKAIGNKYFKVAVISFIIFLYLASFNNSTVGAEALLQWPVEGKLDPDYWYTSTVKKGDYYISSPFGYRGNPLTGPVFWHSGLDLATWSVNRDILAAKSGKVIKVEERTTGYGNNIIIDHGEDMVTLYAHLDTILVENNQILEEGSVIGTAGATGDVTGIHLHFEVRINNRAFDPLPFLGMESRPPINDNFGSGILISAAKNFNIRGTNDGAGKETGEPNHGGISGGKSVWWRWYPPEEGLFYFKTSNSVNTLTNNPFTTTLGIYTGTSVNNLLFRAGSADGGGLTPVLFHGFPEREYHIATDGASGASGLFDISWGEIASGSLNGIITDIDSGELLDKVKVVIDSKTYSYSVETYTDANGFYEFTHLPVGLNDFTFILKNYNPVSRNNISFSDNENKTLNINMQHYIPGPGDVDGKDGVTVMDAILILRYIVGIVELTPAEMERALVSNNDDISVTDAILVLRYVVGLINEFPVETL